MYVHIRHSTSQYISMYRVAIYVKHMKHTTNLYKSSSTSSESMWGNICLTRCSPHDHCGPWRLLNETSSLMRLRAMFDGQKRTRIAFRDTNNKYNLHVSCARSCSIIIVPHWKPMLPGVSRAKYESWRPSYLAVWIQCQGEQGATRCNNQFWWYTLNMEWICVIPLVCFDA